MADVFPNITFDETDVGPRPVVPVTGNRIGVVGEFMKGPNGQFMLVDTPENLIKILGNTRHNGSIAIQTAMDQGARDFGVRRVLGQPVFAGAMLKFALSGAAGSSGKLALFSTAAAVPVVNNVTTKETAVNLLSAAIGKSGVAGLVARQVGGDVLNIQSNFADLPLVFRFGNPANELATVPVSGLVLKHAASGQVIAPNSIVRLASGNLDVKFEYDQSAIKSELSLVINSTADDAADSLAVSVKGISETLTVNKSSVATLSFASVPAQDSVVTLTVGSSAKSYTVPAGATAASIVAALVALFGPGQAPELEYVTVAAGGVGNANLLVTAQANKAFAPITVTASQGSVAYSNGDATASAVKPLIANGPVAVKELKRRFEANQALSALEFSIDSDKLVVKPLAQLADPVALSATVSADAGEITASWTNASLNPISAIVESAHIHVLVGAEAAVTQDVTTLDAMLAALSQSASDRALGARVTLNPDTNELEIRTRFALAPDSSGLRGRESVFMLSQLNDAGSLAVIGQGTAGELSVEYKPMTAAGSYAVLSNGSVKAFAGALGGPQKAIATFEQYKFVRYTAEASLSNNTLTFTKGEVKINGARYDLTNKTASVANISSSDIVASVDSNNAIVVKASTAGANDVVIGSYTSAGGFSTVSKGQAVNGDVLRIEAASEGAWGNDVEVNLEYVEATREVRVTATYIDPMAVNSYSEGFEFKLSDKDALVGSAGYPEIRAAQNSNLIRIFYVNGTEEGKLVKLRTAVQKLVSGEEGPPPNVLDYVRVIDAMALDPVNILIAPGQTHPNIRDRLRIQAEQSNEVTGLRIAVLSAKRGLTPLAAINETRVLDSAYAVMVGGWSTYSNRNDLEALSVPPDGFYAGHLAVTPVEASPAARTSSPSFRGISAVDTVTGSQAFNEYTNARMEMIVADQATQVFHCLNGRSLAIDSAWKWISMRRIYNYIRANAFKNLQFAKSEPNSDELRRSVAGTVDQLLFNMRNKRQIASYQPTKVDAENNPANLVAQGLMRVDMFFTPLYPADFITVGIHRVVPVSLTVQTAQ